MSITWHTEKRKLSDLKSFEDNPRTIKKDAFNRLVKSIKENGYTNRLIVTNGNVVVGGNMRLEALRHLKIDEIEVLVPDKDLSHDEVLRINITDNIHAGDWDIDKLVSWNTDELKEWGISEKLFDINLEEKEGKAKKKKTCPECGAEF